MDINYLFIFVILMDSNYITVFIYFVMLSVKFISYLYFIFYELHVHILRWFSPRDVGEGCF